MISKAIEALKSKGYHVGGMISQEVKKEGTRIGFEIIDLNTGEKGWLAHVNQPEGPQVSKYRVNLRDLNAVGVKAIQAALKEAEVVVIDEIGKMELFSEAFKQVVQDAVNSDALILGVIHQGAQDPFIDSIRQSDDSEITVVTFENRSSLHNTLIQNALKYLQETSHGKR